MKKEDLAKLRKEIVLNSLYTEDYENSFEIEPKKVQDFMDGYMEELNEILFDKKGKDFVNSLSSNEYYNEIFALDNIDNLYNYYESIENVDF